MRTIGVVRRSFQGSLFAGMMVFAFDAHAQRAGENAAAAADDAFGTRVGNESIGLYATDNARGFSPVQAGNVRIDGLYFDQQAALNGRVSRGSTVRVGISAQSYAFPAPTGVADFNLRLPGDTPIVSAMAGGGAFDSYVFEIDAQMPVTQKLSVGIGGAFIRYDNSEASKSIEWNAGVLARARPSDMAEITTFWSQLEGCESEQQMQVIPGGPWLPPRYKRRTFYGQGWTTGNCHSSNGGAIARVNLAGDWTLRAGAFRSQDIQHRSFGDFLREVQPDGTGRRFLFQQPRQAFTSYSGEIRATKIVSHGDVQHTVDFAVRGRNVQRVFGGGDTADLGPGLVGVQTWLTKPDFTFSTQTRDRTEQGTAGVSYGVLWAGVGGLGLGVQKVAYRRDTTPPGLPQVTSKAEPWLVNANTNIFITPALAAYGSYTRGLEESGTAPPSAVNRGEAMPAAITEQIDAGLRYAITPRLNVVAGVFQVEKPYFTFNAANVFGPSGHVRHRGVEVSLAGRVVEGLTVVSGIVLIEPRVTGDAVDRGIIGEVPLGPRPGTGLMSVQYQPLAWNGFGVEGTVTRHSGQVARNDNQLRIEGFTQLDLGLRYYFKVGEAPASFRLRLQNVLNSYGWQVNNGGAISARSPFRYLVNLTADF